MDGKLVVMIVNGWQMKTNILNYIAGLVDGEGSFCIGIGTKKQNKNREPYADFNFCANITLRQEDKFILQYITDYLNLGKST